MPPALPSLSISPQPTHGMPEPDSLGPSSLPAGTLEGVQHGPSFALDPNRIGLALADAESSDEYSDGSSRSAPSTNQSDNDPRIGDTRASVDELIDCDDMLTASMATSPMTPHDGPRPVRKMDFVAVLEENCMLRRASRDSRAEKHKNTKRSVHSSGVDEIAQRDWSSQGSVGPLATSNSMVLSPEGKARLKEETDEILQLFHMDSIINDRTSVESMQPVASMASSDTLMPQHLALARVVRHIFCQVDAPYAADSGSHHPPLQALIFTNAAWIVANPVFTTFFMVLTVYMLFAPDLILLWGNRNLDDDFLLVNTIIFFLFLTEFLLFILGQRRQYLFSANIAMDVVSLLSILVDSMLLNEDDSGDGAAVMRLARTSRMTRLARMARVARVTRLIPRLLRLCRRDRMQLAKIVLFRRLWRTFCFLDTDNDGLVNSFDVRFLYLTIMQECENIMQTVPDRVRLLKADVQSLVSQKSIKERRANLNFEEFLKIILGTGLGKKMEQHHREDVAADRGVLSLTRALGDSTAMKVCIGIIILIGMLSVFEGESMNTSAEQGLAQLDSMARAWHADPDSWNVNFLCKQIHDYTDKHNVDYIFLDGFTYWHHGRCLTDGANKTMLDPLARVSDIIEASTLRHSEFIKACWEDCTSKMTSVALVDNSESDRTIALSGFVQTTVVIFLLLLFVYILNMGITKFSKTMLEPLRAISDDMTALACMDLVHIDKEMPDSEKGERAVKVAEELRQLQMSFHSMKNAVKSWSKYVPPSVVQRLFAAGVEAKIGVIRSNVSIFFCDIVDFEDICCGLPPQQVLALLSTVLELVAEIIHKNKGTLLEFIGDEVLAVFNTPNKTKHHAFQAVRSAFEVHTRVESLPPARTQNGTETKIRLRCGVNTANVLAGNLGSTQRMKYGVLGDGVNLTARMKGLNSRYKSYSLISEYTLQDPLCKRKFITRPADLVAVKGKKEPVRVHELLQPLKRGDSRWMKEAAENHTQAYDRYLSRRFVEAKAMFEQVQATFREHGIDDEPSRLLRSRCIAHMEVPPPEDWDGVERLAKKTF